MITEKLDLFPLRCVLIKDFLSPDEIVQFETAVQLYNVEGPNSNTGMCIKKDYRDNYDKNLYFFYDKVKEQVVENYNLHIEVREAIYNHMNLNEIVPNHLHTTKSHWDIAGLRNICVLTACYYTNSGEGFAKLKINHPQPMGVLIGEDAQFLLEPTPNSLLLFPSWVNHGTTLHGSNITRKCLVLEMVLGKNPGVHKL